MILHIVSFAARPEVPSGDISQVLNDLEGLVEVCDGLLSCEGGPNIDLEGKSAAYSHGFVMRFESRAALEAYAEHPAHVAAGGALVAICDGGADGIVVFDLAI